MEKVDEEERQRRRKITYGEEASSDGKNGDGVEVGWQRKMYKSQKGKEGLEFDVEEELDGWFCGSTTANASCGPSVSDEIARLFGNVSGGAGFGLDSEVLTFGMAKMAKELRLVELVELHVKLALNFSLMKKFEMCLVKRKAMEIYGGDVFKSEIIQSKRKAGRP